MPDQSHAALREEIRRSEGVVTKQLIDARNRQLLAALDENERLRGLLKVCRDTLSDDDSIRPEFLARIDEALRGAAP